MDIEEAKNLLRTAEKSELRDHAFGDCEITWYLNGTEVASGYFGGGECGVSVKEGDDEWSSFKGTDAFELRECFAKLHVERNDETGPDSFVLGQTMPGLTIEGVRKELTGE